MVARGSGGKKRPMGTEHRPRGRPALGRTRVMVPMEPEVLAVFKRMAESGGVAVGRCIADWCRDTAEGAQFVANKMAEARKRPALVMRELHAMGHGMLEEIQQASRDLASKRRA